jgi:muconolactone D-isomerase
MLFYVRMTVRLPSDFDPERAQKLAAEEHARAKELQDQGRWLHLWRVVGKTANVSIFDVESPSELHDILMSMPLFPFMDVEVVALCRHPGSVRAAD